MRFYAAKQFPYFWGRVRNSQQAGGHLVTEEGLLIKTSVIFEGKKPPEATWSQKKGFEFQHMYFFRETKNIWTRYIKKHLFSLS